jgi:metallo-beta-lactamase class B
MFKQKHQRLCILPFFLLFMPFAACAQLSETYRAWNQPVAPFRIIDNVYYVGASDISSFLITTPQGHILLEGGFAETAPLIEKSIRDLGFKPEDVKILLTSHAHFDHAGGLAELKKLTGAGIIVSQAEAKMLEQGGKGDFHYGDQLPFPPVKADRIITDKEEIQLGGVVLTAHLTPGHTPGCTTWTMTTTHEGKSYDIVFMGSISIPGYTLTGNKHYPNIAADHAQSFETLKSLPCDVFLAPHGFNFCLKEKMAKRNEKTNPFIDPAGYQKAIEQAKQDYETRLNSERNPEKPKPGTVTIFNVDQASRLR